VLEKKRSHPVLGKKETTQEKITHTLPCLRKQNPLPPVLEEKMISPSHAQEK
jgi:hypothetical protein